jgi:nitrogen-specific signal transduction histidine kinase
MKSFRLPIILLALVAAFVVPGCGGGDSEAAPTVAEFEAAVGTTRDRVDFALARITKAKSKEEFLNRMDEAAVAIDDAATSFEDAGAAEGFEDEADKLATSLHQLSVDLAATAHDIRQPEFGGLVGGAQGLNFESWDNANLALAGMIGDGLDVKLIGRH